MLKRIKLVSNRKPHPNVQHGHARGLRVQRPNTAYARLKNVTAGICPGSPSLAQKSVVLMASVMPHLNSRGFIPVCRVVAASLGVLCKRGVVTHMLNVVLFAATKRVRCRQSDVFFFDGWRRLLTLVSADVIHRADLPLGDLCVVLLQRWRSVGPKRFSRVRARLVMDFM